MNGVRAKSFTVYDNLYRTIIVSWEEQEDWKQKPIMVGRSGRFYTGDNGVFGGSIDHIQLFHRTLTSREVATLLNKDAGLSLDENIFTSEDYLKHHLYRWSQEGQNLLAQLRTLTSKKLDLVSEVLENGVQKLKCKKKSPARFHTGL